MSETSKPGSSRPRSPQRFEPRKKPASGGNEASPIKGAPMPVKRDFNHVKLSPDEKNAFLDSKRGVRSMQEAAEWLALRGIDDLECITPDLAGVARGKMMPAKKFAANTSLALPSALFMHTISGEYPEESGEFRYSPNDGDLKLVPGPVDPVPSCPGRAIRRRR